MAGENEELIVDVLGNHPNVQIDALLERLGLLADRIVEIHNLAKGLDSVGSGSASLRDAVNAQGRLTNVLEESSAAGQAFNRTYQHGLSVIAAHNGHSEELTRVMANLTKTERESAAAVLLNERARTEANRTMKEEQNVRRAGAQAIEAENKALSSYEVLAAQAARTAVEVAKADTEAAKAALLKAKADKEAEATIAIRTRSMIAQEKELQRLIALEAKAAKQAAQVTPAVKSGAAGPRLDPTTLKYQSERLNELRKGYDLLTESERNNVNIGGVLIARIQELDAMLKKSDAQKGVFKRNVGDYEKATEKLAGANANLGRALGQISGELPNIQYDFRTFLSSISNNILPLVEQFKEVQKAQKEMREAAIANAAVQGQQAAATALAAGASEEAASAIGDLAKEQALAAVEGQKGTSAIKSLLKSLISFQAILAVGIALFGIFGPKIYDFFTGNTKAAKKAEEANKKYSESLEQIDAQSRKTAQEEIIQLKLLTQVAADATRSVQERTNAVLEIQKRYPEYFANLTREKILQGNVADATEKATTAILAQAKASAATKKSAAAGEQLFELQEALKEAQKELEDDSKSGAFGNPFARLSAYLDARNIKEIKAKIKETEKAVVDYAKAADASFSINSEAAPAGSVAELEQRISALKAAIRLQQIDGEDRKRNTAQLIELEKKLREAEGRTTGSSKKDKGSAGVIQQELRGEKELNNAKVELTKQRIQQDIETNQEIFQNEQLSLEIRRQAYERFADDRRKIAAAVLEQELANAKAEGAAAAKTLKDGKKRKQEEVNSLNSTVEASQVKQQAATERHAATLASIQTESSSYLTDLEVKELDQRFQAVTEGLNKIEAAYTDTFTARKLVLDRQFEQGLISQRKYNREVENLQNSAAKEVYRAQIENLEDLIQLFPAGTAEASKLADVLVKLKKDLANVKAPAKEEFEQASKMMQDATSLAQNLAGIAAGLSQRRTDAIDKEIEALRKRGDVELQAIQNSQLSEEEKQKAIAAAKARTNAEEEKLEKQKRARVRQSAIIERGITIAQIVATTALAVVKQLAATPLPAGALAVGAIIAIGAAQLGATLAQPLPAYEFGTDFHPGGKARMFEGNKPELVNENGNYWIGTRDGIYDLARGATVTPLTGISEADVIDWSRAYSLAGPVAKVDPATGRIDLGELKEELRGVRRAVEQQKGNTVNFTNQGLQHLISSGGNVTNYLGGMSC